MAKKNPAPKSAAAPSASSAPSPRLAVIATDKGYYQHQRRRRGERFTLVKPEHFSKHWMEWATPSAKKPAPAKPPAASSQPDDPPASSDVI